MSPPCEIQGMEAPWGVWGRRQTRCPAAKWPQSPLGMLLVPGLHPPSSSHSLLGGRLFWRGGDRRGGSSGEKKNKLG